VRTLRHALQQGKKGTHGLVENVGAELRDAVCIDGLLDELGQRLDGHLEVAVRSSARSRTEYADAPLILLKELGLVVADHVKGKGVAPLEGGAALGEGVDGLLHELDLDPRELARHLDLAHLLLDPDVEVVLELGRLLVVGVAVVVVEVALERGARLGLRVLARLLGVEPVARVPRRAVVGPDAHADPTELFGRSGAGCAVKCSTHLVLALLAGPGNKESACTRATAEVTDM
jgi:hypothetical protein